LNSLQRTQTAIFACCVAATGVAGCATVPTAGPTTSQIMEQVAKEPRQFDMVEIDGRVISAVASQPNGNLRNLNESYGKPPGPTIGIGDTVSVSIWQASNGQLLAPGRTSPESAGPGGAVNLPDQAVGTDGAISVPYAGRVAAAGRTPLQVQQTIEQRLAEQIIQPQAIVTVTKAVSNFATVFDEQATAARVPLPTGSERLLDVIAAAGGSKSSFYEITIRLSRSGQTATIPMTALLSNPQENIFVWPGDTITLAQTPEKFSVFGATSNNTQVPFGSDRLDLAQAIAKAGGLQDQRADPEGVFLFRFEPPTVVKALGVPDLATEPEAKSPVLYHLNLRQVAGYFLAERFAVEDNDLIYVANAPMTELQKFFTLLGTITGPVISGAVLTRGSAP
jgi:polysaccharide export outer membrane protein